MEEQRSEHRALLDETRNLRLFVYIDASFAVHLLRKECCAFC